MINRLYSKLIKYIKENYRFLIFLLVFSIAISLPVPYYIHCTGGLINISDRVSIEGEYDSKGSLNLSYVSEIKGNVLTYLFSFFVKDWDLIKKSAIKSPNENIKELNYRNQMFLKEANQNALIVAYSAAGKYINILDRHNYVLYIDNISNTDIKIKDEVLSVNGVTVDSRSSYLDIVNSTDIGDKLNISVKDEFGNIKNKFVEVKEYNNRHVTGIYFITEKTINAEPNIKFNFKDSESGPSGGFMMALSIYDKLIKIDITKGKKIVGTGTIDESGNVGEISGVKYKLKGAVKEKADMFLVPKENYDEAQKEKKENNYNIEIISINTFADALKYLNEL